MLNTMRMDKVRAVQVDLAWFGFATFTSPEEARCFYLEYSDLLPVAAEPQGRRIHMVAL